MKKTIFTFALLIFAGYTLSAQDWSTSVYLEGKIYPGYIIKTNGDKIDGYLKALSRGSVDGVGNSNQNKVIFYSDPENNKTKIVYKPEDLKGYMIADKYYKAMNYSGGLSAGPIRFLLQLTEGQISRYVWYDHTGRDTQLNPIFEEKFIIQKGDEKPAEESMIMLGFANKVSALVSDNVELANKVRAKEEGYKVTKFYDIIAEYNKWYNETHKN